jgi:hypothetical protein
MNIHDKITDKMSAYKLESGQINAFSLLNELICRGVITVIVAYNDKAMFHVKQLSSQGDYIECKLSEDMILFITKRTPLTIYVSGTL